MKIKIILLVGIYFIIGMLIILYGRNMLEMLPSTAIIILIIGIGIILIGISNIKRITRI